MVFCRVPPPPGNVTLGLQTSMAFGSAYWAPDPTPNDKLADMEGPWVATLVTFAMSVAISAYALSATKGAKVTVMRWVVATWILVTGIVELVRLVWDVSRFALLFATLHNLFEWGIVSFLLFDKRTARQLFPLFSLFILGVNQGVLFAPRLGEGSILHKVFGVKGEIPALTHASLYAQVTGIWVDFLLVLATSYRYFNYKKTCKHVDATRVYRLGFLATATHLIEILPLVALLLGLKPFVQQRPSYHISSIISFTTPITMFLYAEFARAWDRVTAMDEVRRSTDIVDLVNTTMNRVWTFLRGESEKGKCAGKALCRDGATYLECSLPKKTILKLLAIAFALAISSVLLPLIVVPVCGNGLPNKNGLWI